MPILSIFTQYPKEGEIVGKILAGYSDLEIGLMICVMTVRKDFDAVFKTMYRIRGETSRIDVADALGRNHFHEIKLGTPFEMAVGSARHCLQIRNQYAHCAWYGDGSGYIKFSALEEMANKHERFTSFETIPLRRANLALLEEQHAYFDYLDLLLIWLRWEALLHKNPDVKENPHVRPKEPTRPPLHTP